SRSCGKNSDQVTTPSLSLSSSLSGVSSTSLASDRVNSPPFLLSLQEALSVAAVMSTVPRAWKNRHLTVGCRALAGTPGPPLEVDSAGGSFRGVLQQSVSSTTRPAFLASIASRTSERKSGFLSCDSSKKC